MRLRSILLALVVGGCASAPPSPPAPAPAPAAPAAVPPSSNRLSPVASVPQAIAEPRIRVGLLSDQNSATFPRVPDGYYILSDGGAALIRRGFTIAPPLAEGGVRYAVQVSTVSDLTSLHPFVSKLQDETRQPVQSMFDAASGSYRILVGDFPDAQSAAPVRAELVQRGYGSSEMPVVRRPAEQTFPSVHTLTDDEGDRSTIQGQSVLVRPVSADTIVIGGKPYRTSVRLFINARGLYNLINELNLEDYLFGVVPAEMGPKIYDELEALKAQAVAARTYALRNLRGFQSEGYDICPGPACQAYNGYSGEDALSNEAVKQTAGQVLTYQGKLIDALYTSTCGGETSDVATMFPSRSEPYLKRARCVESEMVTLPGRADSGLLTDSQASARTFAALAGLSTQTSSWAAADVERAVLAARRLTGASETDLPRPLSSRRGDVLRYLAGLLELDAKARVTTLPEDRSYYFPRTASPEQQEYLAAAFLLKFGLLPAQEIDRLDLSTAMPREELYALLYSWLREHRSVREITGKIVSTSGRTVILKAEGKIEKYALPEGIPLFRRLGDRLQEYAQVPVMIGDRAFLTLGSNRQPVAMIVQANLDGASFDRTSSFANWTRSYRADELLLSINRRNPIQQVLDLRPLSVDASGRVAELEVTAETGRKIILRGLPIRWSLSVPDNLFVFEKTKDPDGMDRYTFFGKGWGHGIGLCQVGSYGMAFRGWTYDRILKHWYTGVEIVPMSAATR